MEVLLRPDNVDEALSAVYAKFAGRRDLPTMYRVLRTSVEVVTIPAPPPGHPPTAVKP